MSELLDQIREAMPSDIKEAQELLQMRENVINQALLEAKRIRSTAEEEAKALVKESEITKEARKKSEDLIAETQRKAQRILDEADAQARSRGAGADEYALASLQKLEEQLLQVLSTVRQGIVVLDVEREPSA